MILFGSAREVGGEHPFLQVGMLDPAAYEVLERDVLEPCAVDRHVVLLPGRWGLRVRGGR